MKRNIPISLKVFQDFTRVWGCVSSTQYTPIEVSEEELNAFGKKEGMKGKAESWQEVITATQTHRTSNSRAGSDPGAAGPRAAPRRLSSSSSMLPCRPTEV